MTESPLSDGSPTIVDMPRRESEAEIVARHKKAVSDALRPVLEAMDAAKADGFICSWNIGHDYAGRAAIVSLKLVKEF